MAETEAATVRRQVVVDAPIERAFSVFTGRFGDFKPPEHNLLGAPVTETVFEPRVGGGIVDRAEDGSECRWARILAFDPPDRVVFSWDISPRWTIETDQAQMSEVTMKCVSTNPSLGTGNSAIASARPSRVPRRSRPSGRRGSAPRTRSPRRGLARRRCSSR